MGFDQLSGDGKAESQATGWFTRAAIESIEDSCFLAGGKTGTTVCHDKDEASIIAPDARVDCLVRRAVSRRVGKKSRERLLDQSGIDRDMGQVFANCDAYGSISQTRPAQLSH